jgi:hypothetical protein
MLQKLISSDAGVAAGLLDSDGKFCFLLSRPKLFA